jgi:MFS family permease
VWGWTNRYVFGALLLGLLTLGAFIVRSARTPSPALDLTLFRERNFRLANGAMFLFSVAFTAMFFGSILFLTRMWGYTLVQAGLAVMPGPLMVVVFAPLTGRIAAARGHRVLLAPGGLFYVAGALVLTLSSMATPQFVAVWLPAMILLGIGVTLVLPILSSAAVQLLPPRTLAVGSGVSQAIRQFGAVLGAALTFALLGPSPGDVELFKNIFVLMTDLSFLAPGRKGLLPHTQRNEVFKMRGGGITAAELPRAHRTTGDPQYAGQPCCVRPMLVRSVNINWPKA